MLLVYNFVYIFEGNSRIFLAKSTQKKSRHSFESLDFIDNSLVFSWSGKRDSNSRPSAWEADALPTELLPRYWLQK